MKVLITGSCGFVGAALAREFRLHFADVQIFGVDNFSRPGAYLNRTELGKAGIQIFHADIRNASDIDSLPAADWVIDAAANPTVLAGTDGQASSRQLIENNLNGTVNLLEFCKRHGAGFILLSTSRVYSINALIDLPLRLENDGYIFETTARRPQGVSERGLAENFSVAPPLSLYGSSKLASELLALEYGSLFEFPVWINRCGVMAGAGQFGRADQGIFSFWIHSWRARRPLRYIGFNGRGPQVRDALHPRDLVALLRKQMAMTNPEVQRIINLGGGVANSCSLAALSGWCEERFGRHEVESETTPRRFDVPWLVMDYTKANQIWDWRPQTPLADILEEIARHAEANPEWLSLTS